MTVLETEFKPVQGTKITSLTLGTLYTHKSSKQAVLFDAVTEQCYQFDMYDLRRIIGSLKVLERCNVQAQRFYDVGQNQSEYLNMSSNAFCWGQLEFDWNDLEIIDKLINNV